MSAAHHLTSESYLVSCGVCHRQYDALTADWCRCVTKDVAVACPFCDSCVCKQSRGAVRDFWFHAPPALLRMRTHEKDRRKRPASLGAPPSARVLIVDDDEEIRLIAKYALNEMGYDSITANSPQMAMQLLSEERPVLVLTDALMPGGDGRELCREIKALYPEVKVVVMTSLYTANHYATEAYRRFGADAYLAKPIDFDRLAAVLKRHAPVEKRRESA